MNITTRERNSGAVAVPSAYMRLVLPSDSYDEVEGTDGNKVEFALRASEVRARRKVEVGEFSKLALSNPSTT